MSSPEMTNDNKEKSSGVMAIIKAKLLFIITNITLEPYSFVLNFGHAIIGVVSSQMLLYKACVVHLEYPMEICTNLLNHTEENTQVQNFVSFQKFQKFIY